MTFVLYLEPLKSHKEAIRRNNYGVYKLWYEDWKTRSNEWNGFQSKWPCSANLGTRVWSLEGRERPHKDVLQFAYDFQGMGTTSNTQHTYAHIKCFFLFKDLKTGWSDGSADKSMYSRRLGQLHPQCPHQAADPALTSTARGCNSSGLRGQLHSHAHTHAPPHTHSHMKIIKTNEPENGNTKPIQINIIQSNELLKNKAPIIVLKTLQTLLKEINIWTNRNIYRVHGLFIVTRQFRDSMKSYQYWGYISWKLTRWSWSLFGNPKNLK